MNEWSLQQWLHSSKTLIAFLVACSFSILVKLSCSCSESHHAASGPFSAWYIIPQSLAFSIKGSTAAFDAYKFRQHRKFKTAFGSSMFPSPNSPQHVLLKLKVGDKVGETFAHKLIRCFHYTSFYFIILFFTLTTCGVP